MSSFDDRARTWDTPDRQARSEAVAAVIRQHVPLGPRTRAIEVGAGTGLLGLALAPDVGELVLAEPSAGMLEVAREKLSLAGWPNVSAIRFDLLADPPPQPPFDLVLSLLVLHHLEDTPGALGALRELLRPGGHLALADLDAEDGTFHAADAEGIYHLGFEREPLARLAQDAGFAGVAVRTATAIEQRDRRYPLFLLTAQRR
jgi:SAM-dependent methyltransferase